MANANVKIINQVNNNFTQVSNYIIKSDKISGMAKAIYAAIKSVVTQDGEVFTKRRIQSFFKESDYKFNQGWKELKSLEIIKQHPYPNRFGRFNYNYELNENPFKDQDASSNKSSKPSKPINAKKESIKEKAQTVVTNDKQDKYEERQCEEYYNTLSNDVISNEYDCYSDYLSLFYEQNDINTPDAKPEVNIADYGQIEPLYNTNNNTNISNLSIYESEDKKEKYSPNVTIKETYIDNYDSNFAAKNVEQIEITAIKNQIEYDKIAEDCTIEQIEDLDNIVDLAQEILNGHYTVKSNGLKVKYNIVRNKLLTLGRKHIQNILNVFSEVKDEVRNFKAYMAIMLINAKYNYMVNKHIGKPIKDDVNVNVHVPVKVNIKPNSFHNFDQREYDYEALLRQINSTVDLE